MKFHQNTYYHLFNRSNNRELLFKEEENYRYFLRQYRSRFEKLLDTIAYCLMPTHFHFLIFIPGIPSGLHLGGGDHLDLSDLNRLIGDWLSSFTKAINNRYQRNGCLFQRHTKAIPVPDEKYLMTLLTYIHQNPVRSGLVKRLEDWEFSSYRDHAGLRDKGFIKKEIVQDWFQSTHDFRLYSEELISQIDSKVWV